jgi:threonine synthase
VVADDAQAAWGASRLAAQGLWVETCAGGCVSAVAQLLAQRRIEPEHHVLLMLTAKGDRDPFDPSTNS